MRDKHGYADEAIISRARAVHSAPSPRGSSWLRWIPILLLAALVLASCMPKVSVQYLDAQQRKPSTSEVPVYASPEEVGRAHRKIAVLVIEDKRSLRRNETEDLALLAASARELGADAVVVMERRTMTRRTKDPSGGGMIVYHYPRIEAAAIVLEP